MNSPESDSAREARFDEIIASYLEAVAAGAPPDRDELVAEHSDLADSLQAFFRDHDQMGGLLRVERSATDRINDQLTLPLLPIKPDTTPAGDEPTLAYDESGLIEGLPAQRLGDYRLLEKIAQGGMGVVYKAQQISLNRVVALKMIRAGDLADDEEVRRFHAEAEAAAQLDHPGIVPIYQVGVEHGLHYFSMAYVQGQSLAQLAREKPLPPKQAAAYVKKVAEAVHYAHRQGIIHRDIKPANVLIDQNDEPKVTDFGLAKRITSDDNLTISGQILGTASYMSPEQASGRLDAVTTRSDVYSLGALLYAVLTQQPPFAGENPLDIILDVLSKEPVPPGRRMRGLPRDLDTICLKCLDKDPYRRYDSADMLAEDLDRYLAGRPIVARPISNIERAVRWCRRKPLAATTIALLLTIAIAVPLVYGDRAGLRKAFDVVINALPRNNSYTAEPDDLAARLIANAQRHAASQSSQNRSPLDDAYFAAAVAMLHYSDRDVGVSAEKQFRNAAQKIEQVMAVDQENDSLKSALADCYVQLSRRNIRRDRLRARRELRQARKMLDELAAVHPDNLELEDRAFTTDMQLMVLASQAEKRKSFRPRPGATSEQPFGLIRFRLDPVASLPRENDSSGKEETQSITQLQGRIQSDPQDTRTRLELADAYYQAGELEAAWDHYRPAFQLFQILEKGSPDREQQALFASAYRIAAGILLTLDRPALAWDIIQDGIELHLKLLDFDDSSTTRAGLRASYALLSELSCRWPKDQRPNPIRSAIWPTDALAFYDAVLELRTVRIILD